MSKHRLKFVLIGCWLALLPGARYSSANVVILAWDANTDPDLAGYKVYFGTKSGVYGTPLDAGNATLYAVTGLNHGTYYFAVTAYNHAGSESSFSNEVSTKVGVGDGISPTLSIRSPIPSGAFTASTPNITIAGSSSDNKGVTAVMWSNSAGGSGLATGTTNWSATITLAAGINQITVLAKDAAGNAASATLDVTFTAPPATSDLNGDGHTDVIDLQILSDVLLGGVCPSNCDINGDGIVDVLDLQRLADIILGVVTIP